MKIILVIIITLFASSVCASVYKCRVNGQINYQQIPCAEENHGEAIEVKPNVVSTKGLRTYIKKDRKPKKLREKKVKAALDAKKKWMNREVGLYSKNEELKTTQQSKKKTKREELYRSK